MPVRAIIETASSPASSARQAQVPAGPLGDLVADPHHRVQRGHRLLEDHRDLRTHQSAALLRRHRQQVARRRTRPGRPAPRRRGAAARRWRAGSCDLPDPDSPTMPIRSTGLDVEGDVRRRSRSVRAAGRRGTPTVQVLHAQQRLDGTRAWLVHSVTSAAPGRAGRRARHRVSESPRLVTTTARPGMVACSHKVVMNSWPSRIIAPHSGGRRRDAQARGSPG